MVLEHNNNNHYHIVDLSTLGNILHLLNSLKNDPRYSLLRAHKVSHLLKTEASKHSADIETGRKKGKHIARVRDNLVSAQDYFSRNYSGFLNHDIIFDLEELLMGSSYRLPYRGENDRVRAMGYAFFYPRHVSSEMTSFFSDNDLTKNAVEKALHAHFNIARIHPFNDGNGRLARLVQNGILDKAGLPPIDISPLERGDYMDLINAAQVEHRDNEGQLKENQVKLYRFLAVRLLQSLKESRKSL